jgi:hypothetical protein
MIRDMRSHDCERGTPRACATVAWVTVVLLAILPVWGAEDANAIVKRSIEAQSKNWERASQYTYVEQADYFSFDKNGQPKKDRSETHEIIFVEGLTYKKLIARNERPLEPKEQSKVDKLMQRIAKERREQRHSGLFHKEISLGSDDDLLTLFRQSRTGRGGDSGP